jgi:hypothetical protein
MGFSNWPKTLRNPWDWYKSVRSPENTPVPQNCGNIPNSHGHPYNYKIQRTKRWIEGKIFDDPRIQWSLILHTFKIESPTRTAKLPPSPTQPRQTGHIPKQTEWRRTHPRLPGHSPTPVFLTNRIARRPQFALRHR